MNPESETTDGKKRIINSSECLVCFLDILGYGSIVSSGKYDPSDFCKQLTGIIKKMDERIILKLYPDTSDKKGLLIKLKDNLKIQVLSDSLLFILDVENITHSDDVPISPERIEGEKGYSIDARDFCIQHFFYIIGWFYVFFASEIKYLLRGGLAFGKYFQQEMDKPENQLIFSKTMIDSVKLEKDVAVVPRILIRDDLSNDLSKKYKDSGLFAMLKDKDDRYYVDIYSCFLNFYTIIKNNISMLELLNNIVTGVKERFSESNSAKDWGKYQWFRNYHNNHPISETISEEKGEEFLMPELR